MDVSSSEVPSLTGFPVKFTARLAAEGVVLSQSGEIPGALMPTGFVQFRVNGNPAGQVEVNGGVAEFSTDMIPSGTNVITAEYAGDTNHKGSQASLTQIVVDSLPEPRIVSVSDSPNKILVVRFQGNPGGSYLVQATSNLQPPVTWENVSTNTAGKWDGMWIYSEDMTRYQMRFFRAVNP
jgi:hypothetical protein